MSKYKREDFPFLDEDTYFGLKDNDTLGDIPISTGKTYAIVRCDSDYDVHSFENDTKGWSKLLKLIQNYVETDNSEDNSQELLGVYQYDKQIHFELHTELKWGSVCVAFNDITI